MGMAVMDIRMDLLVNAWYTGGVDVINHQPEQLEGDRVVLDIAVGRPGKARTTGPPTSTSGLTSEAGTDLFTRRTACTTCRPAVDSWCSGRTFPSPGRPGRLPQPADDGLGKPTLQRAAGGPCGRPSALPGVAAGVTDVSERVVRSGRGAPLDADRVLFPDGITKGDLWDYYAAVAHALVRTCATDRSR